MDIEKSLEKIAVMMTTAEGRQELLQRLGVANAAPEARESTVSSPPPKERTDTTPSEKEEVNANVHAALEQLSLNREQLQKKESFLKKMLMLPVRGVQALGRTMKKHKALTAVVGIAALIALLYFLPMPPGVGRLRDSMIQAGKEVLRKVGVSLPEPAVDAIANVPATGGAVAPEVMRHAEEILSSPSAVQEEIRQLGEILK